KPFKVKTSLEEFIAECIIIASGASARKLGLPNEDEYIGRGLHTCATCDGAFYRGKNVAIVGGGDAAMEEAMFLTKFAEKVQIIHRKDILAASIPMQERVKNNPKIEFIWNTEVVELVGENRKLDHIKIKNVVSQEVSGLKIDGLFLAIGHIPNTKAFKDQLELDQKDYIKVSDFTKSSVEGVFVAGDVWDWRYRQAITASGLGCMAALDAEKYLSSTFLEAKK
ncbi:MAG: FAD-dependent oxidoreductase, partial [Candidatus Komeilibacteria bacterium]|nr:FAD-dependent oxidoreductase [Candidatus Komeilibacteria bacterium]